MVRKPMRRSCSSYWRGRCTTTRSSSWAPCRCIWRATRRAPASPPRWARARRSSRPRAPAVRRSQAEARPATRPRPTARRWPRPPSSGGGPPRWRSGPSKRCAALGCAGAACGRPRRRCRRCWRRSRCSSCTARSSTGAASHRRTCRIAACACPCSGWTGPPSSVGLGTRSTSRTGRRRPTGCGRRGPRGTPSPRPRRCWPPPCSSCGRGTTLAATASSSSRRTGSAAPWARAVAWAARRPKRSASAMPRAA
mmetsp:Transcript_80936/g.247333  ORF Transcript_80936/g.247333 Transcript_80936/m.247333 type:complete len:252 (-) Transcript_80936:30-785(-)